MNINKFAATLFASLVLASAAGAAQHKDYPRAEDRNMSAYSDSHYWATDRGLAPSSRSNGLPTTLDALNPNPLTSANGS